MSEQLTVARDGTHSLRGRLTFATVQSVNEALLGLLEQKSREPILLDLSAVYAADSAGLALLLDTAEQASDRGHSLRFRNLPQELLDLARISNVESLLPLD